MIILTILVFLSLMCITVVVAKYISEKISREWLLIPLLAVFVTTILSLLSIMNLHEKINKLENEKPRYEEVTETFYRKIK